MNTFGHPSCLYSWVILPIATGRAASSPVAGQHGLVVSAITHPISYCAWFRRAVITLFLILLGMMALSGKEAHAEFTLNFQIQNQGAAYNDGYWDSTVYHSTGVTNQYGPDSLSNQTPWVHTDNWHLPEIVYDASNGKRYYHVLFGSMDQGFMQEFFIEVASGTYWGGTDHSVDSKDTPGSSSGGEGDYLIGANGVVDRFGNPAGGNGADPLGTDPTIDSGNGSGNPGRVIMRQVVTDGEIMMEFLKDSYSKKPRITQILNTPTMTQLFDLDMRTVGYNDKVTQTPMTNVTLLWGEGVPANAAEIDIAAIAQQSNVTAGQYTYSEGLGSGGASGTYDYTSGVFDHVNQSWINFFDPLVDNPWSFETAKKK